MLASPWAECFLVRDHLMFTLDRNLIKSIRFLSSKQQQWFTIDLGSLLSSF